jgi:hypothetical protein
MRTRPRHSSWLIVCGAFLAVVGGLMPEVLAQSPPSLAGCPVLPANSIWNTPIDNLPTDPNSGMYVTSIGATKGVHPDFGAGLWNGGPIGIPYNLVPGSQPTVPISFDYADESDPGPYPFPSDPAIEGGSQASGDRHVLVLDGDRCVLYETWSTNPRGDGGWHAGSGAIFDLKSNKLRPSGWTSSDAAGLPVLPGLVRYEEVAAGEIPHAIRFTAPQTRKEFIWPARHYASNLTDQKYPPMGQRFRLRASFNIAGFAPEVQVILQALKKYGMILADNGSSWYLSGVPDPRWNDDVLVNQLKLIKGSDFEAVDESSLMLDPDSGEARTGILPLNPNPPDQAVRLVFVHHSTGENWLADGNGKLGIALRDNNYFVSDTNYGWGPDDIGSSTDIGHWWRWFRGPNSDLYLNALYDESEQHASFARIPGLPPTNENEVILFKSCFPNSALQGNPDDPLPQIDQNPLRGQDSGSSHHTVANAKGIYTDLLETFGTRQDKLFVAVTAPPLSDPTYAANARAFNEWLMKEWLKDYPYKNVAVFDYYNVLTTNGGSSALNDLGKETGNHHRLWQNAVQHKTSGDNDNNPNVLEYPSASGDDHPSAAGNLKATGEFVPLLNVFYHCWKGTGACPGETPPDRPIISVAPGSHSFGSLKVGETSAPRTFTIANTGQGLLVLGSIGITGQDPEEFSEAFDGCSDQTLGPADNCTEHISFSPHTAGLKAAALNIPSNDALRPEVNIPLSGTAVEPTTLTLVSPNGGETWEAESKQEIRWRFTGKPGSMLKIQLLKGGTSVRTIRARASVGLNGVGAYSWLIPENQPPGSDYRITITSTQNASYSDTSDQAFTINAPPQPTIAVVVPNGGESWQKGTTQMIQWAYTGNPGPFVRLQLLKGTTVVRTIAAKIPTGENLAGSFNWKIPFSLKPASSFKVKVASTADASLKDESNESFTISK